MYENEKNTAGNAENTANNINPYYDYNAASAFENKQDKRKAKKEKKKERRSGMGVVRKVILCASLGLCFGVFSAAGFYGVRYAADRWLPRQEVPVEAGDSKVDSVILPFDGEYTTNQITYVQDDITGTVNSVMPAMVSIINNYTDMSINMWGQTYTRPSVSSGSGIIVGETEEELLIATNNHVVASADKLEITFIDGSTAEAVIKGTDEDMDLAVIAVPVSKLSDETKAAIAVAVLGDSDNLQLGEPVIAIGNALGYGQSVTDGIISALNREIETENGATGTFIQTNAAINPGNSGGALLNIRGEVIGINSNKIGGSVIEGMGYAIPISAARPILAELMERETRTEKLDEDEIGYIGITMQTISSDIASVYGWPKGVCVIEIAEGSPADKSDLLKGDIIVKFNGQRISLATDLQSVLQYYRAGETVTLTVKRLINGEYEDVDVELTLGERPKELGK